MKLVQRNLLGLFLLALCSSFSFADPFTGSYSIGNVSSRGLDGAFFDTEPTQSDFSATVDITAPDGGVEAFGELEVIIEGDFTGVAGVTAPNLFGGTTALFVEGNQASMTINGGVTDVRGGAITFTLDGTTNITSREFTLTVEYTADVNPETDSETLIDGEVLAVWGDLCEEPSLYRIAEVGDNGIVVRGTIDCDYVVRLTNDAGSTEYVVTIDTPISRGAVSLGTGTLNITVPADTLIEVGSVGGAFVGAINTVPTLGEWALLGFIALLGFAAMRFTRQH